MTTERNAQGVDVLAAMDRGIADLMDGHPTMWTARDVRAMRAAVAELVEALRSSRELNAWAMECFGFDADLSKADGVLAKFPEPRP